MINRKANMLPLVLVILIALIVFGVISVKITGNSFGESERNDEFAQRVSQLKPLNLEDVNNYEKYKNVADNVNDLIIIISEKTGAKIPKLETTTEAWGKASKLITKYGPLINNYNAVVFAAKDYNSNKTVESYQKFYRETGKFSLEITFISAALFHEVTFNVVGGVFNSLGIGSLALKCPSCASTIMSGAYWTVKTTLVESASKGADIIFEKLGYKQR